MTEDLPYRTYLVPNIPKPMILVKIRQKDKWNKLGSQDMDTHQMKNIYNT